MEHMNKIKKKFHIFELVIGISSVRAQGTQENLEKFYKTSAGEHKYSLITLANKFFSGVADVEGIY